MHELAQGRESDLVTCARAAYARQWKCARGCSELLDPVGSDLALTVGRECRGTIAPHPLWNFLCRLRKPPWHRATGVL